MKVLVVAPHPDDEVLGCGGMIAKRAKNGDEVYVCIVTKGMPPVFNPVLIEQGRREDAEAAGILGVKRTLFLDYPAAELDKVGLGKLSRHFIEIIKNIEPDEVYIPHHGDMHFDHRIVSEAVMVGVRPKYSHVVRRVYAYETLSETGWNIPSTQNEFIPTVYENITDTMENKIEAMNIFKSQLEDFPGPRSITSIEALAKYRGSTVGVEYAEAFSLIREIK